MVRVALFNDTRSHDSHFGCAIVMRNLEHLLKLSGMRPTWYHPVGKDWRKHLNELPERGSVDVVIVNGEGSMHHSESRPRADCLAEIATMARERLGVTAFLVNTTLYDNSDTFYDKLKAYSGIYVRDSASADLLRSHSIAANVVPDLTLAFDKEIAKSGRLGVAATDSVLPQITKSLRSASKANDWQFCPMVRIKPPTWREVRRPLRFARRVTAYLADRSHRVRSPESFLQLLQTRSIAITGRYHAVTLCLLTRTPFVAIESNTPKITNLLTDVFSSTERLLLDTADMQPSKLEAYAEWAPGELRSIDTFLRKAGAECRKMFLEIKNSALKSPVQI